jgi:adhesin transport system outer membrane protein
MASAALSLLLGAASSMAQPADALRSAVEQALTGNPDVASRFNAYRASADAIDASRAAYLPRVDLNAAAGRDTSRYDNQTPATQTLSRTSVGASVTQLLWDGLGTKNDVARAGHERLARYFELIDVTEQTALEAARAYYDVQRYRRLVTLAEDNYVQHRYAVLQINSRVRAGVGRGVDLEQANARLALAESNLNAELSNLHDVTARYERVVGSLPPAQMPAGPSLGSTLPATPEETLRTALQRNAAISASIESLRSARSSVSLREAAYQPRIDARVRGGVGNNIDGLVNQHSNATGEIILSWNLFNGGGDRARVRQQTNLLNQAADLRDKACRDTRQTTVIAFNDTRKLVDQLRFLDRNTIAIEKARDAYRQQFDIGQRSLLDLLNSENELYTARRAYANAEYDLVTAHARAHAAMNQLVAQLGIARGDSLPSAPGDWSADGDAPGRCPVLAPEVQATPLADLDARAQRMTANAPPPVATPPVTPLRPVPVPTR